MHKLSYRVGQRRTSNRVIPDLQDEIEILRRKEIYYNSKMPFIL